MNFFFIVSFDFSSMVFEMMRRIELEYERFLASYIEGRAEGEGIHIFENL